MDMVLMDISQELGHLKFGTFLCIRWHLNAKPVLLRPSLEPLQVNHLLLQEAVP